MHIAGLHGALLENTQIRGPGRVTARTGLNRVSYGSGDNLGGACLPSVRDVLPVFFHKHNTEKLTVRVSARTVFSQVLDLRAKTKIPVILSCHIINLIISLHNEWKNVMSHKTRTIPHKARTMVLLKKIKPKTSVQNSAAHLIFQNKTTLLV